MANGQLNGTDLGVYIGGTLVAYSTNATININHSPRSTTNKESGGWEENMEGLRNWDVSVDALYAWLQPDGNPISNETLSEIFTAYMETRTKLGLTFGVTTTGSGDTKYYGDAWLTSISLTAPLEDTSTFSASFQGTGELQQQVS
tara:strand:+ start:61 stop:495 length:435 start_codon:yes stop_codon:yes gene_type:complete